MAQASIGWVRQAFRNGAYRLTEHAEHERETDAITLGEIKEAFASAKLELLEDYPNDPRGPSALFLGFTREGSPLHAVIALSSPGVVVLVTLYRPRPDLWYDWRRRA